MKLPQFQKDALLVLRTRLDPGNPENTASAEIKEHLKAIEPWLESWVFPAVDSISSSANFSERWIREEVSSWARKIRLSQGRGAHSPDTKEIQDVK
jgi:hypothetical protein